MPDPKRYPPLFLDETHRKSSGYTRQKTGRNEGEKTVRNRQSHARRIQSGLERAWEEAEGSRQAVGTTTSHGIYLEFEIDLNSEMPIKTLDPRNKGVELRNVRTETDGKTIRQFATVFVPAGQRSYFVNLVEAYSLKDTKGGNPRNQKFIESIDDIRAAVLESFWTHGTRELPGNDPQWVEIWLQDPTPELTSKEESASQIVSEFRALLPELQIEEQADRAILKFPERAVILIRANREQLASLAAVSDTLAEIRPAAELASFFIDELTREEQAGFISDLRDRLQIDDDLEVAVCILDGGVNRGHPILEPVLKSTDCHTIKPEWGTSDSHPDGHGTMMAGIGAFGDLKSAIEGNESVLVEHCLESSKLLPPPPEINPKRLWGDYTAQAISRAEITPRRARVIVMAVSSLEDMDRGKPSSWSGKLDQIISGAEDDIRRLFLIASGNTDDQELHQNYPDGLLVSSVHNPGQAWNALAIGGFTQKVDLELDNGQELVAADGEVSPFTSTSNTWDEKRWPIKPEIVLEAGNAVRDRSNFISEHEDLSVLTTEAKFQEHGYFTTFNGTSAASAYAAWLAARIHVAYPDLWPETVRALIVHSANWTPEMLGQFLNGEGKTDYARLARACGWGVPNLAKALTCPQNTLTLISEAPFQPFGLSEDRKRRVTNEMHLYELPWPKDDLLELGEADVSMRITLSYYVEPSPGEIGWKDRYRYASHGLRFEINKPGEERLEFEKRINQQALEEEEKKPKGSAADFWTIGSTARDTGSIHSDIWKGSAAALADSNLVAIYPVIGWWRERPHLGKWNKSTRYSLIISIETPDEEVDIYTPVATQIGISTPVPVEIEIGL
jgi:hypothetical protein